jgi:hypothetical protein
MTDAFTLFVIPSGGCEESFPAVRFGTVQALLFFAGGLKIMNQFVVRSPFMLRRRRPYII